MCRSHAQGGRRCPGSTSRPGGYTEDEERYLRRIEQLDAAPDGAELLADESLDRGTVAADDAAQRMIAERAAAEPQWA